MEAKVVSFDAGRRLSQIMSDRGISNERLADMAGISEATVRRIRADRSTGYMDTWVRVAKALGVSIDSLFGIGG